MITPHVANGVNSTRPLDDDEDDGEDTDDEDDFRAFIDALYADVKDIAAGIDSPAPSAPSFDRTQD